MNAPWSGKLITCPGLGLAALAIVTAGATYLAISSMEPASTSVAGTAATLAGTASTVDAAVKPALPASLPAAPDLPFGARIGGDFELIDHNGVKTTLASFEGRHVLFFFGYANCEAICSAALPAMAQVVDALADAPVELTPVMITVDPERDTPDALKASLPGHHEDFIGLTGSRAQLEMAWEAFQIDVREVARDWNNEPILAHGSFIYLFGPDGEMDTLLPPVLAPQEMARIVRSYL